MLKLTEEAETDLLKQKEAEHVKNKNKSNESLGLKKPVKRLNRS